ncbi:MAG: alpha/beta hydrolase [Monoglobales bacterium]
MKKSTRNILIGTGIVTSSLIGAGVVSYFVTKKLVEIAMDRNQNEIVDISNKKIEEIPELKAFKEKREQSAKELGKTYTETIEIIARDNTKLIGHWSICKNAKRIVIAVHGWRSSWTMDFGMIADFLQKNGCNVLYVEQRGQNNSGGEYIGFGLTERYDCLEWINWLKEQDIEELPIYLCGVSMGASTVLMTAGFELPSNVHGIIADCGYTSPYAIWKYVAENSLHFYYDHIMSDIADDMCRAKIKIGPKDYSCPQAMEKCDVPVLFIHGTDDDFVPVEMTYENYKACKAPKRLLVVPGAGHGMSYMVDQNKYEQAVKQFWEDFDRLEPDEDR